MTNYIYSNGFIENENGIPIFHHIYRRVNIINAFRLQLTTSDLRSVFFVKIKILCLTNCRRGNIPKGVSIKKLVGIVEVLSKVHLYRKQI